MISSLRSRGKLDHKVGVGSVGDCFDFVLEDERLLVLLARELDLLLLLERLRELVLFFRVVFRFWVMGDG